MLHGQITMASGAADPLAAAQGRRLAGCIPGGLAPGQPGGPLLRQSGIFRENEAVAEAFAAAHPEFATLSCAELLAHCMFPNAEQVRHAMEAEVEVGEGAEQRAGRAGQIGRS